MVRECAVFITAVLLLAGALCAEGSPELRNVSIEELFQRTLVTEADEYVDIRDEIVSRGNSVVVFLKIKSNDTDWKTAVLAQAMLGRITDPEGYDRFESTIRGCLRSRGRPGSIISGRILEKLMPIPENKVPMRRWATEIPVEYNPTVPLLAEIALKGSLIIPDPELSPEISEQYQQLTKDPNALQDQALRDHVLAQVSRYNIEKSAVKKQRSLSRPFAVDMLGWRDDPFVFPVLAEMLTSDDIRLRTRAANKIRGSGAVEILSQSLAEVGALVNKSDKQNNVLFGQVCAWSLGELGDPNAAGVLMRIAKDKKVENLVRESAVTALGKTGGSGTVELLKSLVTDMNMRWKAALSLGRLDMDELHEFAYHSNPRARVAVADALYKFKDSRSVDTFIYMLNDPEEDVRRHSIGALGLMKDKRAVDPLIRVMNKDADNGVRSDAVEALGWLEDPRAVDSLIAALGHSYRPIKDKAITALGSIEDQRAIPALQAISENEKEDRGIRSNAKRAIERLKRSKRRK